MNPGVSKLKCKQTFAAKRASFLSCYYSANKTSLNQVAASWSSGWRATKSPSSLWREQSGRSCSNLSRSARAAASRPNHGSAPTRLPTSSLSNLCVRSELNSPQVGVCVLHMHTCTQWKHQSQSTKTQHFCASLTREKQTSQAAFMVA